MGKWQREVTHSLTHSDARDILEASAMNTFFTPRVTGNPYNGVRVVVVEDFDAELLSLRSTVLITADSRVLQATREEDPLKCIVGTVDGSPPVELPDFLASPGLQVS